jgi:biopolymer transport protein TolQ
MDVYYVTPFAAFGRSVIQLVLDTGPFAKFILIVLFSISVISWAIIIDRVRLYRRLRKGGRTLQMAVTTKGIDVPVETIDRCLPSVEGALLLEARRYVDHRNTFRGDQLRDLLQSRAMSEVSEMEKYLIFLATTASISPFLGLLGTVWGIMSSFLSMGVEGTASIEVVGPGIAEALATTIAGLAAAIVALVGYNLLVRYVRRQETRIDFFISRLLALIEPRQAGTTRTQSEVSYEEKPI